MSDGRFGCPESSGTQILGKPLFGVLLPGLFHLMTGPGRWFYAGLLEHLDGELFGAGAGPARQREVLSAISEYIDRRGHGASMQEDEALRDVRSGPLASPTSVAYVRLLSTGWIVKHRNRYRRSVDFDAGARLLLELIGPAPRAGNATCPPPVHARPCVPRIPSGASCLPRTHGCQPGKNPGLP